MKTLLKFLFFTLFLFHLTSCGEDDHLLSCGEGEQLRWFINEETHGVEFDDIHVYYADDRMLYIFAEPTEYAPETFVSIRYDILEETATYSACASNENDDYICSFGSDLEMTVSSFSSVGDLICIEFDNGEFRGEFRVILDKVVESATVKGKVWLDENNNGLRDANESALINASLSLKTDFENLLPGMLDVRPNYDPTFSVLSNDEGEFTFEGVFIDHPIRVSYFTRTDPTLSTANVGNDDAVDSDFYLSRALSDKKWYHTDVFMIEEGGTKDDIGLGIVEE